MSLLSKKLIFVLGKGGVGRTTVSVTLGMAAARSGLNVGIIELYGTHNLADRCGFKGARYAPRTVAPGVQIQSFTAMDCVDDFGRQKLRIGPLSGVLFKNKVFGTFIDAIPGLHDLFQLGKVNALLSDPAPSDPKYDLIIIDTPATGHGITLLHAAESMREMVGGGLVAEEADLIADLLSDPARTGLVLTTLPDTLPVNETLELVDQLEGYEQHLCGAVVNGIRDFTIPKSPDWSHVKSGLSSAEHQDLCALGDELVTLSHRQQQAIDGLRHGLADRLPTAVPLLMQQRHSPGELEARHLPNLGQELYDRLQPPGGRGE